MNSLFQWQGNGAALEQTLAILIVDDEERMRSSLLQLLEAPDREFHEAGSGREGILHMQQREFDLVLLDIKLPDLSGVEVMEWIATHRPTTSVIFISVDSSIDSAILALRGGAKDYIRKPFDTAQIQHKVDYALYNRRLERSHTLIAARLEHSEKLHRFLVEHSPDLIYTIDRFGCFMFINARCESMLGFAREELLGRPYFTIVHDEDIAKAHYAFNERRKESRGTSNIEVRLKCRKDGPGQGESGHIVAMLSAMGVYESQNSSAGPVYLGTYGVARDITERKVAEKTIAFHLYHDQLTRLPNQRLFKDRLLAALDSARPRGGMVGVIFIDLDRFKRINETYGHSEGDELLKVVAQRLSSCMRSGDTVARKGGDEFTVILPELHQAEDAAIIAEKILETFSQPFLVAGQECRITASLGIAVFPRDGEDVDALLKHADIAMYRVKDGGKNDMKFFTPEMNVSTCNRINLENDLRLALVGTGLELYYQPQVNACTMAIVGVEALLRWHHPIYGTLSPPAFIGIAEESGLIGDVTDWVLRAACRQIMEWRKMGLTALRMAVNFSPKDFQRNDMVDGVLAHVSANNLPSGTLEIEITENMLLRNSSQVVSTMRRLRELGILISIDDFGTCYSSLNYLRQFPISAIKIDRSFVRDLSESNPTSPIIPAIIGIARGFDLQLVAEGIETAYQMQALRALGCDEMQGYYFSRPVPAGQMEEMLRQGGEWIRSDANASET